MVLNSISMDTYIANYLALQRNTCFLPRSINSYIQEIMLQPVSSQTKKTTFYRLTEYRLYCLKHKLILVN